jgi:hypothetical protein
MSHRTGASPAKDSHCDYTLHIAGNSNNTTSRSAPSNLLKWFRSQCYIQQHSVAANDQSTMQPLLAGNHCPRLHTLQICNADPATVDMQSDDAG